MGLPVQKTDQKYTCGDYLTRDDDERWELFDGHAYKMIFSPTLSSDCNSQRSPAPSPTHQEILGKLYLCFAGYFEGKKCKVYFAPFDVRLPKGNEADEEIDTVVQ